MNCDFLVLWGPLVDFLLSQVTVDSVGVIEEIRMAHATELAAQPLYHDEGDSVSTKAVSKFLVNFI
jgi:hypothetical protein